MQRVSNVALTLALPALITSVSLVLIAAAWLLATYCLNGLTLVGWPR